MSGARETLSYEPQLDGIAAETMNHEHADRSARNYVTAAVCVYFLNFVHEGNSLRVG